MTSAINALRCSCTPSTDSSDFVISLRGVSCSITRTGKRWSETRGTISHDRSINMRGIRTCCGVNTIVLRHYNAASLSKEGTYSKKANDERANDSCFVRHCASPIETFMFFFRLNMIVQFCHAFLAEGNRYGFPHIVDEFVSVTEERPLSGLVPAAVSASALALNCVIMSSY
jgi:hypothetical protein